MTKIEIDNTTDWKTAVKEKLEGLGIKRLDLTLVDFHDNLATPSIKDFPLGALKLAFPGVQTRLLQLAGILDQTGIIIPGKENKKMTFDVDRSHLANINGQPNDIRSVLKYMIPLGNYLGSISDVFGILSSTSVKHMESDPKKYMPIHEELKKAHLSKIPFNADGDLDVGGIEFRRTYGWFTEKTKKSEALKNIFDKVSQSGLGANKICLVMDDNLQILDEITCEAIKQGLMVVRVLNLETQRQADGIKALEPFQKAQLEKAYRDYLFYCLPPTLQALVTAIEEKSAAQKEAADIKKQIETIRKELIPLQDQKQKYPIISWLSDISFSPLIDESLVESSKTQESSDSVIATVRPSLATDGTFITTSTLQRISQILESPNSCVATPGGTPPVEVGRDDIFSEASPLPISMPPKPTMPIASSAPISMLLKPPPLMFPTPSLSRSESLSPVEPCRSLNSDSLSPLLSFSLPHCRPSTEELNEGKSRTPPFAGKTPAARFFHTRCASSLSVQSGSSAASTMGPSSNPSLSPDLSPRSSFPVFLPHFLTSPKGFVEEQTPLTNKTSVSVPPSFSTERTPPPNGSKKPGLRPVASLPPTSCKTQATLRTSRTPPFFGPEWPPFPSVALLQGSSTPKVHFAVES